MGTMKILLDPILTASPDRCSTMVQFHEFVTRTLKQRQDVFFYWLIAERITAQEFEWFPKHPNVVYMTYPAALDRVREYMTMHRELEEALAFNGMTWDFDVILTTRTTMVPLMRLIMNSPREYGRSWTKEVWLVEEMPALEAKPTVPKMLPGVHERMTLEGYFASDRVFMVSYHEKPMALTAARQYFTPSMVQHLDRKITNVITSQFGQYKLKKPAQMFDKNNPDHQFGVAYIGRMEKANGIVEINELLLKSWVLRSKMKLVVCTVSKVLKEFSTEHFDVRFPGREEFWKIVEHDLHAFVKMPAGGGFTLSLIEPIMLGTPVITVRTEDYEYLLGKDYPFFAPGPGGLAGLLRALYEDYPKWYGKFADWHQNWFKPTYEKRMIDDLIYPKLDAEIDRFMQKQYDSQGKLSNLAENEIVCLLAEKMKGGDMDVLGAVRLLEDEGKIADLARKAGPQFRLNWGITFSTPWNQFRLGLKLFHGYEDASTRVGHLRQIKT